MPFQSILFQNSVDRQKQEALEEPACFGDLNLDQVIDTLTAGKQEYHLKPFFSIPLHDVDAILYRHEIMRDLEHAPLMEALQMFAKNMRIMRANLAQAEKLYYRIQKEAWFLDAVERYCAALENLAQKLDQIVVHSRGFMAFREYMTTYLHSERFLSLLEETRQLKADFSSITYCLEIRGNNVKVRRYDGEADYSAEVAQTFEKFRQGAVKDYLVKLADWPDMDHVEAHILDLVAKLYPDIFSRLDQYNEHQRAYLDETIAIFDREVQFYLAYLEYLARFQRKGLPFCYPHLSMTEKQEEVSEGFDVALAQKLLSEQAPVVCNDVFLQGRERILVVTGPNQGGKTTFARAFGQAHYLASLGCPVPGREARLFLCDQVLTHFEKEEDMTNLRGKLQDDLVRIDQLLRQATSNSLIILNEIFTSTAMRDASFLSTQILEKLIERDLLAVCVTFLDELATLGTQTVSMVSTIVPEQPAMRTYKIIRKQADGLAYALAIAEKYRLTSQSLKERIPS